MIALCVEGLRWCERAGWLLVLCDTHGARRLQVTLPLPDALALGHELAGRWTERTGLYGLVGSLLHERPCAASVQLLLGETQRAKVALVMEDEDGEQTYAMSTADGVALAVRSRLPLFADQALMDAFGMEREGHTHAPPAPAAAEPAARPTEIPEAFRLALDDR